MSDPKMTAQAVAAHTASVVDVATGEAVYDYETNRTGTVATVTRVRCLMHKACPGGRVGVDFGGTFETGTCTAALVREPDGRLALRKPGHVSARALSHRCAECGQPAPAPVVPRQPSGRMFPRRMAPVPAQCAACEDRMLLRHWLRSIDVEVAAQRRRLTEFEAGLVASCRRLIAQRRPLSVRQRAALGRLYARCTA